LQVRRRPIVIILLVLGAAALAGCSAAGSSPSAAPTTTSTSAAPTTTIPPTTTTTLSQGVTIHQWAVANESAILNLTNDVNALAQAETPCASEPFDYCLGTVQGACSAVAGAVQGAQEDVPAVPDPQAEALWSQGLSDYASGAQACTTAIAQDSNAIFDQAIQQMSAGKSELEQLVSLVGSTPSSST
jgi:hypothetical protein